MIKEQNKKRYIIILIVCMIMNVIALFLIEPSRIFLPIVMLVVITVLLVIQIRQKD